MKSLPKAHEPQLLDSRAFACLQRIRRDLVASLFTRQGIFWDEVAGLRARRGITATVGVPPPADDRVLLPANAPKHSKWERGAQAQEESQEEWFARLHKDYAAFEYKWALLEDLESILRKTVPVRYRGYRNSTMVECPEWVSWQRFNAACVLYDPPETSLSVFARYSEPGLAGTVCGQQDLGRKDAHLVLPARRCLQET